MLPWNRSTKDNSINDADRLHLATSQLAGKRLTYANLGAGATANPK
jgi:hypothetical protein